MTRISRQILWAILFLLSACFEASAQRDQVFSGTRPMSMAGAFVAVADDGNAILWNPAGLGRMERIQASFAYANLFGLDIHNYYASFISRLYFIPVLTDYLTAGVDWSGIYFGDDELTFNRDQFNLALGFKPPRNLPYLRDLTLGVNLKHLRIDGALANIAETETNASGWGWDAGLLYQVNKLPIVPGQVKLGLMLHDVGDTRVAHDGTQRKENAQHQSLRWGLSYQPFENWPGRKLPISAPLLALDFDERVHVGLEFWLARVLAVRCGFQKDLNTDENATLSFGLGFRTQVKDWPEASVDYAFTDSPVLANTNRQFGGSLVFTENPRLIRIEKAHVNDVFPALYLHYGLPAAELGALKLKNVSAETLKTWISFTGNRYLTSQRPDTVMIAPEATIDFPLRAVFAAEIFHAPERRLSGEATATYVYHGNEHNSIATIDFAVHGKNALTWDDPGKAAAFVTFEHPVVKNFVDQALAQTKVLDEEHWFLRYHGAEAVILFDALQAYGFTYRPDPVTPFPALADTLRGARYRVDRIQYPSEFLSSENRFGDCDDSSVLFASLLQQAGLSTALVSGPGHIFMMFDTYLPISRLHALPLSSHLFVKHNGTLWIPLETTMIPAASFMEAWSTAAERLRNTANDTTWTVFDVASHQARYPPVASELLAPPAPLRQLLPDFAPSLQRDLMALEVAKQHYLQTFADRLATVLPSAEEDSLRNQYGILLGQNDDYAPAKEQFRTVVEKNPAFSPAWHNWGNVEFVQGNFAWAESLYTKALEHNPFSRATYLNLAILYQMMITNSGEDSAHFAQKSEQALLRAAQLLEGNANEAFAILGFEAELAGGKAESFVDKIKARVRKVKEFVDTSFKKYVQRREIRGVALDRHGVKGEGELDGDRAELLAWSY